MLLISLMEWFTSHGCAPVRNMSMASVPRVPAMHVIYSQYLGGLAGYVPVLILACSLCAVIMIAGYAGALYFAAGFLSIILVFLFQLI